MCCKNHLFHHDGGQVDALGRAGDEHLSGNSVGVLLVHLHVRVGLALQKRQGKTKQNKKKAERAKTFFFLLGGIGINTETVGRKREGAQELPNMPSICVKI